MTQEPTGALLVSDPSASLPVVQGDDIRHLDRGWSLNRIMMLLDGQVEIDGELHEGLSAYEMRELAQSGAARDFTDLIGDVAQLDQAILAGIQKDTQVRVAMLLRTRGGLDEFEIERLLDSDRPGYALLQRGAELVRRHERGRHSQLLRVRANRGESDQPVCWRCLTAPVNQPGQWCGCIDKERKSDRSLTGPGATYDPLAQPDPSQMTAEERQAEIDKLAATQVKAPIPGGENYRKKVQPAGTTFFDPDDLRRSDRLYRRFGSDTASGIAKPHHDSREQVPSK